MAVYVTLYRYTDAGMKNIKRAAEIARGWQQEAQKHKVEVKALYWLHGAYDAVTIIESDDDDSVTALLLAIGEQGYLRTETMRASSIDDVQRAIQRLGG